jgi:hypothetical protein
METQDWTRRCTQSNLYPQWHILARTPTSTPLPFSCFYQLVSDTNNFGIFLRQQAYSLASSGKHKSSFIQCKRYMKGKDRKAFKTIFERKFLLKLLENIYTNGRRKSSCLYSIIVAMDFCVCRGYTATSQDRFEGKSLVRLGSVFRKGAKDKYSQRS